MATRTITTRTPATGPDNAEDGVAFWDWTDNNPDEDGRLRFFKNGWEAVMENGRIIRGSKATKIDHLPGLVAHERPVHQRPRHDQAQMRRLLPQHARRRGAC